MKNSYKSDEILDLVDLDNRVIGQKKRSEIYAEKLVNYRLTGAMIVNSTGQLWIPRRTNHKQILPGHLVTSMGGHVETGETYLQAFRRELMEELFIDLDTVAYRELGFLTPHQHGVSSGFSLMYEIKLDQILDYNKDDFFEAFWLTPQEFFDRLAQGEKAGSILVKTIEHFYRHV